MFTNDAWGVCALIEMGENKSILLAKIEQIADRNASLRGGFIPRHLE
jgi:hypothetical protein